LGYYSIGVGAVQVRRVATQPTHPWSFRSADRYLPNGTTDSTNGGWWEGYSPTRVITPEMFGAYATGLATDDDYPAISAALAYVHILNSEVSSPTPTNGMGTYDIWFPGETYYSSQTLVINNPTNDATVRIFGRQNGVGSSAFQATIYFPINTTGFFVRTAPHGGGRIEGLRLHSEGGTSTSVYGMHIQTSVVIQDVVIDGFPYDGIYMDGTSGNNCDFSYLSRISVINIGRHGLITNGGDANVILGFELQFREIGGSGIWENSAFGGTYINTQVAGSGFLQYQKLPNVKGAVAIGSDGNAYSVVPYQEAAASTTDPVTDTNAVAWRRCPFPGSAVSAWSQPWSTGLTWQSAPGVYNGNASQFYNLYVEAPYSPPFEGSFLDLTYAVSTDNVYNGVESWNSHGYRQVNTGYTVNNVGEPRSSAAADTLTVTLGGDPGTLNAFYSNWSGYPNADVTVRYGNNDLLWEGSASTAPNTWFMGYTTGSTSAAIGPGNIWFANGIALASPYYNGQYGRLVTQGAGPPTAGSWVVGSFVFNVVGGPSSVFGWRCTVAGSPGTWEPLRAGSGTGFTIATLPSAASAGQGARAFVTNGPATAPAFGSTPSATGTGIWPVFCNGAGWIYG
jgi:hypothetical protein